MRKRRLDAPQLDWLCDVSGRYARVTSIGGRLLLVENHTGILQFSDTRILLATRCGDIAIDGMNLSLSEARSDLLAVRGRILSVRLPDMQEAPREE